jgi:hypothetical protein
MSPSGHGRAVQRVEAGFLQQRAMTGFGGDMRRAATIQNCHFRARTQQRPRTGRDAGLILNSRSEARMVPRW